MAVKRTGAKGTANKADATVSKTVAEKPESAKVETTGAEDQNPETAKVKTPENDSVNSETAKVETPGVEDQNPETANVKTPENDSVNSETAKVETPGVEDQIPETAKVDEKKAHTPKVDTSKAKTAKVDAPKNQTPKADSAKSNVKTKLDLSEDVSQFFAKQKSAKAVYATSDGFLFPIKKYAADHGSTLEIKDVETFVNPNSIEVTEAEDVE